MYAELHLQTHTGMFMVQTEDFSLFSHCFVIVYFSDVPIGFVHKICPRREFFPDPFC